MKPPSLGRRLLFALLAGLGTLPWQLLFAPGVGYGCSFGSYMLMLAIAAPLFQAPSLRRGCAAAGLTALVLVPIALATPTPLGALFAGLCMLGVGRSALCYRRPLARALGVELGLALGATFIAALLYDARLFGSALAVWAFWLVQSAFALLPGRTESVDATSGDAFDDARDAAERLLRTG
jgi:hypothetical protein